MNTRMPSTALFLLLVSASVAPILTQDPALPGPEARPDKHPAQPREPTSQASENECFPGASEHNLSVPQSSADLSYITDFGLDLFRELYPYNTTQRNFFFSPYSVWSALSLAYFGSMGQTEQELASVLGLTDKVTALKSWRALEFLYAMRQANKSSYTFSVANRAYFDQSVKLRPCIESILTSELATVDFTRPDLAAEEINSFIFKTTKGRIQELVTPSLVAGARLVLTNAAFFKGTWLYRFKESSTSKALFYSTFEDFSFVDMMRQKGSFRYGVSEELGANILELPYDGEALSMYILLPAFVAGEDGFSAMVERLSGPVLHQALSNTWRSQMEVLLPKFRLEELLEEEMIEALRRMGIRDLFDPVRADLSTFTAAEQVSVGRSVHRAFVEVSEEGTEAAAATALISWRVARPVAPTKFEANHPFLFLIYDNLTRNVLFLGAYKSPKTSQSA
ncbi:serine protease inhibitor 88Ea-like [Eriocheir sinensis]|uniref:serine protease inhibitor 88Ea-like n=1 Tax=Eriocheir sinensis TaxID=95602 RepID=UPI0021CA7FE9|nr:serine protease inhibitor 88Ea-like [Eriocheir sinensis]XP_050703282.1 serine protease inhibitor 88Ea-like [Eriocheir sinensis]XP_050703283.1 serine protease inhibitor 88Ea-like [Eriocheir sinensis]XP_050703284.1 serine protease inhibitor 88Ea-like [Eriocheir sinensis]XP_050703285.1 serine protease inhibitor 88Ea-like [Eriocheir sinensis]